MRIASQERAAIKKIIRKLDKRAEIYLYGSRANDTLRGGDIDLLIVSNRLLLTDKLNCLIKIKDALGEQKIDILIKSAEDFRSDHFVAQILKSAVLL